MLYKQKGSSMIEILVSLVVLALGLLGIAGMQIISMKNANNSEHRYRASIVAYDMMERMRSNLPGVFAGEYDDVIVDLDSEDNDGDCSSLCTSSNLAAFDVQMWKQKVIALPNGTGTVVDNGAGFEITVAWNEQNTNRDQSLQVNALLANEYKLEFEL